MLVLPHVPIGKSWRATCTLYEQRLEKTFEGPKEVGERVEVEFSVPREACIFTGRAVDQHGKPLPDELLTIHLVGEDGKSPKLHGSTDEEGRFAFGVWKRFVGKTIESITFTVPPIDKALERTGSIPFRRRLEPAPSDLGDVVLPLAPVIVSGELVGLGDHRSFRDRVYLHLERLTAAKGGGTQGVWTRTSHSPKWREGHRFEFRGTLPDSRLRLVVTTPAILPLAPVEFVAGTKDLEVPIRRGGTLRAKLLGESEIPGRELVLVLYATAGDMRRAVFD
jgi:hypothetical protein